MPDSNTSVMFMPDDAPAAPAAPKTYSREALVAKGMSKGWDRARAEAAADVKLARETAKVWESAAPGEDFSAVAKRAGELVPDVYTAPEEVSSMPTFPRQKVELPVARPAPVASERWKDRPLRPLSSLTPEEVRSISVAENAREDVAAEAARERAADTAKFFPPLGFAMGGPAGAALGAGVGAFAKPFAAGVARIQERMGDQGPTVTELALREQSVEQMPVPATAVLQPSATTRALLANRPAPSLFDLSLRSQEVASMPTAQDEIPGIAYRVPETSLPSELVSAAGDRLYDLADVSMAFPATVSDAITGIVQEAPGVVARSLRNYSEWAARTNAQNTVKPFGRSRGKEPTLETLAEVAESWGSIPMQGTRERATSARMFKQNPEEIVPLGDYRLDQALFDIIDTPEGAVEKGLDTTMGFQMWEKEHPERARVAREKVAVQKAATAAVERPKQREAVRVRAVEDYLSANILPAIEKMKDYNLTPDEYRALQVAGALTGRQTEEGDIELAAGAGGERVLEMLKLRKEDPDTFAALIGALPQSP
jgi:hypothetical protein